MSDEKPKPAASAPAAPPKPMHPGALWVGKRTDELDVPPTPLKLPQKKPQSS